MEKRFGSMESFFKGYIEQQQEIKSKKSQYKYDDEIILRDILTILTESTKKTMTLLELQSWLLIQPIALRRIIKDLERKKLVKISKPVDGEIMITITKSGEQIVK